MLELILTELVTTLNIFSDFFFLVKQSLYYRDGVLSASRHADRIKYRIKSAFLLDTAEVVTECELSFSDV